MMIRLKNFLFGLLALSLFFGAVACDDSDPYARIMVDYSTVPDAFDTTQAINKYEVGTGIMVYDMEHGTGTDTSTINSGYYLHLTGRFDDGEIFFSTRQNSQTDSIPYSYNPDPRYEGFVPKGVYYGLVGSVVGDVKSILVPFRYGITTTTTRANNTLRYLYGQPLLYDIEVLRIYNEQVVSQ